MTIFVTRGARDDSFTICVASTDHIMAFLLLLTAAGLKQISAQTEGDTGYDYNDNDMYEGTEYDPVSPLGKEPLFDVPIVNITVKVGETALLPCSVLYIGKYKVAWLDNHSIPLTFEDRRIIDESRFSVVRPKIKEWNLQIQDVRLVDAGSYRCTVNTKPVITKLVWLHVVVPAIINDVLSTNDVIAPEGENVTLVCNATGIPAPEITWYRGHSASRSIDNGETQTACKQLTINENLEKGGILSRGPIFKILNVTRDCEGIFECQAFNGFHKPDSRIMKLTVQFRPQIILPNRKIGQSRGKQTILECTTTGYPHALIQWMKGDKILTASHKYTIEAYDENPHTITLSLRILDIGESDYGQYKCVAMNELGKDEQSMLLFEYIETNSSKHSSTHTTFSPTRLPPVFIYETHLKFGNRSVISGTDDTVEFHSWFANSQATSSNAIGCECHVTQTMLAVCSWTMTFQIYWRS